MAKRRTTEPRKRRTREHVIADLGVHHVQGHVLRCGYTMQFITPDYGLDLVLTTFTRRGTLENGLIWVQVKATDHPQRPLGQAVLAVRIERRDLLSWVGERYPVILVVYDATTDTAYWLHVQAEYGGGRMFTLERRGSTVTVHVPLGQVVTEVAIRQWRGLKAKEVGQ
ncbi:MAG: DUF4365 domain-containing protein [Planctomycetia bacterium]|nr:DUF4365 domain-containing protein [Planctomycetia bacterium]